MTRNQAIFWHIRIIIAEFTVYAAIIWAAVEYLMDHPIKAILILILAGPISCLPVWSAMPYHHH